MRSTLFLFIAATLAASTSPAVAGKSWPSKKADKPEPKKPAKPTTPPKAKAKAKSKPAKRVAETPPPPPAPPPAPVPVPEVTAVAEPTPEPVPVVEVAPPAPPAPAPIPVIVQCVMAPSPAPEPAPAIAAEPAAAVDPTVVAMVVEEAHASASTIAPPADVEMAGYDKGFFIRSPDGKYTMTIGARLVSRYSTTTTVTDGERTATTAFEVPSAPIIFKGQLGSPKFAYKTEIDLGKGFVALKDFFADLGIAGKAKLRAGQFTRPFSRQQINSSGSLELGDRAITDKAFGAGRDLGVELHDDLEKSPTFEWAVGVFNGTGEAGKFSGTAGDDGAVTGGFGNVPARFKPVVVGRFGINTKDLKGYAEADLEGGPARAGVAGSVLIEGDADDDGKSVTRVEVDGIVKAFGFSASAAIFEQTQQEGEWAYRDHDAWGFHLQTGYAIAGKHEIIARVAVVDPDHADDATAETAVGYTLYLRRHDVKWQTDLGVVHHAGHPFDDGLRARTQLQLGF